MSRIVLVTGAAAGIGLATAQAFAAGGDTVVLADIDADAAVARAAKLGPRHLGIAMDVADEAMVEAAVTRVARRFGRINVLVNNAGIVDPGARPALDVPLDTVAWLIDVNLTGSFAVARAAARAMIASGGAIVNIASGAALSALPGRAAYGMTKAAILGLTRSLAREWAGAGVRVNAVLPGYVETEILRSLRREGRFDPAVVARAIPLGRLATPEEIAAVVRHAAATGVTGAALLVDGGVEAFGGAGAASTAPAPIALPGGCAVVFGASDLGAELAGRWIAEGLATVVIDRDPAAVAMPPSDRTGMAVDVADPDALAAAVADIEARFGPIGRMAIVVGPTHRGTPITDRTVAKFGITMSTDLTGALVAARAAAPSMFRRGGGAIVYLVPAGDEGETVAAGVSLLTQALACEWAGRGVRVNAVARARLDPDETAAAVDLASFLASDAASYVTGAVWPG